MDWVGERYNTKDKILKVVEEEKDKIQKNNTSDIFNEEERNMLNNLECKVRRPLTNGEVDWKLKSRAIWFENSDEKNKIFHHFSNHRKRMNTIWE